MAADMDLDMVERALVAGDRETLRGVLNRVFVRLVEASSLFRWADVFIDRLVSSSYLHDPLRVNWHDR